MKEVLDKITSYNLFNYLLPGVIFVTVCNQFVGYDLVQENNILGAFLYYFIGMAISRFGSLFIEPVLKKAKFLKFAEYKDYVAASKKDNKIELLSEVNNTYRTITSLFTVTLMAKLYCFIDQAYLIPKEFTALFVIATLLLMFLYSYRKQTQYVTKRIAANK